MRSVKTRITGSSWKLVVVVVAFDLETRSRLRRPAPPSIVDGGCIGRDCAVAGRAWGDEEKRDGLEKLQESWSTGQPCAHGASRQWRPVPDECAARRVPGRSRHRSTCTGCHLRVQRGGDVDKAWLGSPWTRPLPPRRVADRARQHGHIYRGIGCRHQDRPQHPPAALRSLSLASVTLVALGPAHRGAGTQ